MSTTSFRIDKDLESKLETTSLQLQRSKGWIINEALRLFLEREERRQRMLVETEEAIADIDAHRIVSGQEVMEWLETWGTPREKTPPEI